MKPSIAIVVPCYNEEEILRSTILTLLTTIDEMVSENIIDRSETSTIGYSFDKIKFRVLILDITEFRI